MGQGGMEKLKQIWPVMAEMARDLDMPYVNVQAWFRVGNVPWWWHQRVIDAAKIKGHVLTADDFTKAR